MKGQSIFETTPCSSISWRYTPVAFALLLALVPVAAMADNYFNPAFLSDDPSAVADLSRFTKGDGQAPGTYRVDVYLNDNFVTTRDVTFTSAGDTASAMGPTGTSPAPNTVPSSGNGASASTEGEQTEITPQAAPTSLGTTGLQACMTVHNLDTMGVNLQAFPVFKTMKPDECVVLEKSIPDAKATLDFEKLRLDISIPQAALRNDARGYIPPEQWDDGINAVISNYNFNGSNSKSNGAKTTSEFLSLQNGLNLGAWRLRDNSTWNYSSGDNIETKSDWQHVSTYVERAIAPLKAELTAGDTSTPSDVFDSLPIRGAQLASDDNMLPDSMKGFAPTIRGIAKSNAKVSIKQNGYVIYQTYVAPGAFAITDLFPTSSSGDLDVSVTETDGSVQNYTIPYSAVPILQREGRLKYAISAAEYRSGNDQQDSPDFGQGTLIWGLPRGYTVYGGTQFSDDYRSVALGLGKNLGDLGALSVDVTDAHSTLADGSDHHGQSMRFLYAKALNDLGTNFQLLGYRYSTEGFYTLDETTYKIMSGYNSVNQETDSQGNVVPPSYSDYYNLYYTKRGKVQVSLSQQIGSGASVFVTGSQQSYWHTDELNTLVQAGYNGTLGDVTYSLAYNYNKAPGQPAADQIFSLNLSLPIGKWLSPGGNGGDITQAPNNAYATYNNSTDNHGNVNQQAGVNGTLLKDNNLSYSVMEGTGNNGVGNSGSTSLSYQGRYGNTNAGYNYSSDYQQVNYGASGGIVLHRNGLTLSQPLGDTNVLIAAPGAGDVTVENNNGVKTDWRGYAVVPYASTYRQNRIALDPTTLNDHTDLDDAVINVVPTQGAIVRANFNARVGVRALLTIIHNGKPVPFGASVSRTDIDNSGIVGDGGQVYMSGLPLTGTLQVQWGNGATQKCTASYKLPNDSLNKAIIYSKVVCK